MSLDIGIYPSDIIGKWIASYSETVQGGATYLLK